jgi:hypothetical protein
VKEVGDPGRLPAQELITAGLRDLERGVESIEALVVSIGTPRLAWAGVSVTAPFSMPEHRLYRLLSERYGDGAHSQYNSLVRRLVSFERAATSASRPHA